MWKHFVRLRGVPHVLLDAEVVDTDIEVQSRGHADRAKIGRPVRTRAHVVELGQAGNLAQVADAPRVNDRRADVIDELFLNEPVAIVNRREHFADRERRRRVLADESEPLLKLGGDGVFEPE